MLSCGIVAEPLACDCAVRACSDENWDNWMRLDTVAKGRECIIPEVNRNFNFGTKGANMNINMYKRLIENMNFYEVEPALFAHHMP